ncbi:MAG: four helix bundle protein [Candidatus Schekmanbacteria bacterium]|nr:four helix bundle protein [Candidatus Schekmanbacteria bacterium]
MARDYTKLKVFCLADQLVLDIYKVTPRFPKSELLGLISQMRRSAVSVPANIVEGSYRTSLAEYIKFLSIALGSLAELGYYIELSSKLHYLQDNEYIELKNKHVECIKSLQAMINSLREKLN